MLPLTESSASTIARFECIPPHFFDSFGGKVRRQISERTFARLALGAYVATGASFPVKAVWPLRLASCACSFHLARHVSLSAGRCDEEGASEISVLSE
jgi:hypothetical protein